MLRGVGERNGGRRRRLRGKEEEEEKWKVEKGPEGEVVDVLC